MGVSLGLSSRFAVLWASNGDDLDGMSLIFSYLGQLSLAPKFSPFT